MCLLHNMVYGYLIQLYIFTKNQITKKETMDHIYKLEPFIFDR